MIVIPETDIENIWKKLEEYHISENKVKQKTPRIKCLCNQEPEIIEQDSDIICENCGLILDSFNISFEAEWRDFNNENSVGTNKGNRVGNPVDSLIPETSMSTTMSGSDSRMKNLNMWLSIPYKEKILLNIKLKIPKK